MGIKDALLPEFDHEMGTTRRVLERVPEADFAWRPHERSMSLGQLARHLTDLPMWFSMILDRTDYDLQTLDRRSPEPPSRDKLLQEFDGKVAAARACLLERSDAEMLAPWTLRKGGDEIFTMPRISAVRGFVMNHSIHHRGQLSVYLRLRNVPLPPIYGPTADEE